MNSQSSTATGARGEEAGQNAVPSDGRVARRGGMDMQYDNRVTTRGSVVRSSRSTMVVRTDSGRHVLFTFDPDAERPQSVAVGTRVRVVSRPGDDGIQVASYVAQDTESPDSSAIDRSYGGDDPVPDDIRRLERQVARQARRFRAGVRAGAGLDPEILTAGVHATMGPFFSDDVWFRPNAEFGFGEVTKMFAINLEGIYRLPVTSRQSQWMVYAGAGPGVNFISRNYEKAQSGERDIDFSDFDFEAGLNFLVGVERRSGMFLEFKASAYSSPNVRFLVGYNFWIAVHRYAAVPSMGGLRSQREVLSDLPLFVLWAYGRSRMAWRSMGELLDAPWLPNVFCTLSPASACRLRAGR